ncbi:hypothetical protein QO227_22060 [Vibrio vulnificus]|uniref:hypothetical protein n=1 Tax=Vibrio TaxID=662 RepID=UPI0013028E66|nr:MULTISPECIES: hypothetical protein [Vibrio]MDK2605069.1 hypothetical protein [Vibrio vulnificus]MDK2627015.1 hypothetical protein [Vibrio vulnificus]MDK2644531.1 hypothetical protein [Vibrio vulnificus]MDK2670930.1 hypothetical protein [Vibrio vulnificus]MDK2721719.1 hypothetical protein [Vibrio vulnificus]
MSLKEIMKLRMTITRRTIIYSSTLEVSSTPDSEADDNVITLADYASGEEVFSVEEWREKLELQLKEAELSFHYKDS